MRIVPFRDTIIWPAFSRMGFDPTVDLLTDLGDACTRYVNNWVRKGWDITDWPELSKTEPRNPVNHLIPYDAAVQPPNNYSQTQTFNRDQVVRDPNSTKVYISVINSNLGRQLIDPTAWALVSPWNPSNTYLAGSVPIPSSTPLSLAVDPVSGIVYIALQVIQPGTVLADSLRNQAGWLPITSQQQPPANITNIGRILKVYPVDPTMNDGPFDIPFREYDSAFHVGYFHGTTVWVKFMTRTAQFTFTKYSATTTYNQYSLTNAVTDLVYSFTLGECFASASPNNTNNPLPTSIGVSTAHWTWVPFPLVLAEFAWRGLYSDLLRDADKTGQAQVEEQQAYQDLQITIDRNGLTRYDKLTDQQTGVPRYIAQPVAPAA